MDRSLGKARASRKQRLGEAVRKAKPARPSGGRGRVPRVVKSRGSTVPVPANDTELTPPQEILIEDVALESEVMVPGMDVSAEDAATIREGAASPAVIDLESGEDVSAEAEDTETD